MPQPTRRRTRPSLSVAVWLASAGLIVLAGCTGLGEPAPIAEAQPRPLAIGNPAGFDQGASAALLAQAQAAETAGNLTEAIRLYREAGLVWPETLDAWTGLAAAAERTQTLPEAEAAAFVADRLRLYPSDALYTQREVNTALRLFVAEQRGLPEANPAQIAYAERLADFYDHLYAARGPYEPPSDVVNLQAREIPAVILSFGGLIGYAVAIAAGGADSGD